MLELFTVAWTINGNALCVCDTLLGVITIAQDCPVFNAVFIEKAMKSGGTGMQLGQSKKGQAA